MSKGRAKTKIKSKMRKKMRRLKRKLKLKGTLARIPTPPPTIVHKDKKKYDRKIKHKNKEQE